MNPLNPFFAIVIFLIVFGTAYLINLKYKFSNDNVRFETIDGLRGFLAFGVFIHHSAIWFQFLQIKSWELPKSNLYSHLGQTSVSFFFMITAFLFVTKLLNTNKEIDWNAIFISRFFRLVPMYFVSLLVLVLIVFIISNWELKVTFTELVKELFYWVTFTIFGTPSINTYSNTSIINAGVVWSLPYEWLFYFSLPVISLLMLKKVNSIMYLIISIIFIVLFYKFKGANIHHFLSFAGGAISPFLIKYGPKKIKYDSAFFSIIILLCLASILYFPTPNSFYCKFLIIVIFNLVVLGNSIFGILKNSTLKFLGEISYSTYLIHGIILFIVMYFIFGFEKATSLSPTEFCITIFIITPLVVLASFLSYKKIEHPFMVYSKKYLRKRQNVKQELLEKQGEMYTK
ncbi:acyltransferase family protein [Chryseobacterium sp. MIQD13]|uniref:acyltransferase family protein n=1 Tax=Chryseobacterium sp. MIQD13 TaxID=3422310 RepID=UPI003D2D05C4